MGGSGGGGIFSGRSSPGDLRRQVRDSENRATNEEFATQVAQLIDAELGTINQRDKEAIGRHIEEIKRAFGHEIEGSLSLLFGGSIAKRTYVNGLSDVDSIVILNKSELVDMSPIEVKKYFARQLQRRFPNTPVEIGNLAVTIKFRDIEIQLLPGVKAGQGVRISAPDGSKWSSVIRPDKFATKLTDLNRSMNGKLVPTIKLTKKILSKLPEDQQLSGYHVESLAIKAFESYGGSKTTKEMLRHFFANASEHIKLPLRDSSGQSIHVDDYLGGAGNLKRRIIGDSIGRISRSMQNADGAQSTDQWADILNIEL
ncbi:MAG: nucleotidyltransferase [Nitrospirales bacterium]|nr:MAG: nucleotidyltransferase [Nitrospirales bacterium]